MRKEDQRLGVGPFLWQFLFELSYMLKEADTLPLFLGQENKHFQNGHIY